MALGIAIFIWLSVSSASRAAFTIDSPVGSAFDAVGDAERLALSHASVDPATPEGDPSATDDAEACTIAVATGISTTMDGRPVLWKNRDYYGRPEAWQATLFWHQATGRTFSISDTFGDRFNYVAVSDQGDRREPPVITETLYYPWMGANEKGLGLVQAQAHTLASETQVAEVGIPSQDPKGIGNGGLNHWILSRCETVDEVENLLSITNDGGGYNGSTARDTASLIAVIDRFGGAAIFELDGSSFARQNITQAFGPLDERLHSSGPPVEGYGGFDYRSNFSRITFTNTIISFPYFPDVCTNTITNSQVITVCEGVGDGINDLEDSTSSVERWGRVEARMDDYLVDGQPVIDHQYFIQKWLRKEAYPREFYLETVARSVGYAPYLTTRVNSAPTPTPTHNWKQEKPTGWHLNRFVTVSSAVIVGSKAGDQDEGKLTTMWVALGEPSVAIFVPVFPYAGQPPDVLDDFFLSTNAKRRLVYDYETDAEGYPIDDIAADSAYTRLRNHDHSIDLAALFGGNYYGEGGLQAYNFAIEEELYKKYQAQMNVWRGLPADQITPGLLASWQGEQATWATGEYVKSDPAVTTYEAEDESVCSATTGTEIQLDEYEGGARVDEWAWQMSANGVLSCAHQFTGDTIVEVIAMGAPEDGQWPRMKVWVGETCLAEVGGETEVDCSVVVTPTNATDKAKDVGDDAIVPDLPRFVPYRYRTTFSGVAAITMEAVDATLTRTLSIDKIIVRTEPRSVEMYEVERDWDDLSSLGVDVYETYVRLNEPGSHFDIHHYVWGRPLTIEVVVGSVDSDPPWPEIGLHYTRTLADTGWQQIGLTETVTASYAVLSFVLPSPAFQGMASFRIRSGNDSSLRVDKLLVKESFPVDSNTAPVGYIALDSAISGPTRTVTATAVITDPDGDTITSYFWDFGDGESYCSGNPVVTHTYGVTANAYPITLYATDHRGKTAVIPCRRVYIPIVMKR